jgi:beta-barrel assembly-enhancing protease
VNPPPGPRLENRLPAEGINSSDESPLREALWLVGGALVVLALLVALVGWSARWLAPHLPFAAEVALAERWIDPAHARPPTRTPLAQHRAREQALQALADRVAAAMALPADMPLVVTADDSLRLNAYATLGGRIRVFGGLVDALVATGREDALAALLAHEIAHVQQRHIAANAGRGLAVSLLLSVLSADAGAYAARQVLGQAAGIALLGYSREQETEADLAALAALVALYGHGQGVLVLFDRLGAKMPDGPDGPAGAVPEVLRSHPLTERRRAAVVTEATRQGWAISGPAPTPDTAL